MTTGRSSGAGDAPRRRSAPSSRRRRSARIGASSSTSSTEATAAGEVGRPHGLDGSFYVIRPLPALLVQGARVVVATGVRTIVRRSGTDAKPIVRLDGSSSREDAEALRGQALLIANSELPSLEEGEYWAHELEGCTVTDGERVLGVVSRMVTLPSCEALEVEDRLIPLVRDAVRSVDVAGRRIDVDLAFLG